MDIREFGDYRDQAALSALAAGAAVVVRTETRAVTRVGFLSARKENAVFSLVRVVHPFEFSGQLVDHGSELWIEYDPDAPTSPENVLADWAREHPGFSRSAFDRFLEDAGRLPDEVYSEDDMLCVETQYATYRQPLALMVQWTRATVAIGDKCPLRGDLMDWLASGAE